MLAEFSVVPLGTGESVSQYVAECLKIVVASGVAYRINPMGTVLEGDYDEIMSTIRKCHMKVMGMTSRCITSVKIDDRKGAKSALKSKIESVEKLVGTKLTQ